MTDDTKAILGALRTQTGEWQEPEWSRARRLQAADTIERLERELVEAREDAERLEWVLPIVGGDDSVEGDRRAIALAHQLMLCLPVRAAIDAARAKERG